MNEVKGTRMKRSVFISPSTSVCLSLWFDKLSDCSDELLILSSPSGERERDDKGLEEAGQPLPGRPFVDGWDDDMVCGVPEDFRGQLDVVWSHFEHRPVLQAHFRCKRLLCCLCIIEIDDVPFFKGINGCNISNLLYKSFFEYLQISNDYCQMFTINYIYIYINGFEGYNKEL